MSIFPCLTFFQMAIYTYLIIHIHRMLVLANFVPVEYLRIHISFIVCKLNGSRFLNNSQYLPHGGHDATRKFIRAE